MRMPPLPKFFRDLNRRTADIREAALVERSSRKRHLVRFTGSNHEVLAIKEDESEEYDIGEILLIECPQHSRNQLGGWYVIAGRARNRVRIPAE